MRARKSKASVQVSIFMVSLAFLAFTLGAVMVERGQGWLPQTAHAFNAGFSALSRLVQGDVLMDFRYGRAAMPMPASWAESVVVHDEARAVPGVNLVNTAGSPSARLMDMHGKVLHEWHLALPKTEKSWYLPFISPGLADTPEYFRRVHLFPNGDLIAIYENPVKTPHGAGMVKMDRNSNPIWSVDHNIHHDLDIAADGTIFTLGMGIDETPVPVLPRVQAPWIRETVLAIGPDGEVLREIDLLDAYLNSPYRGFAYQVMNTDEAGDVIHSNTVQIVTVDMAEVFPFAEPGDLLLSFRNMGTIAVLDMKREIIRWQMAGLFMRQHEPQILANGHILLFDNAGNFKEGEGYSRVVEIDPVRRRIVWQLGRTGEHPFRSRGFGAQYRLPGGHTLIIDSMRGRAVEVTADGHVVWEMRTPEKVEGLEDRIPSLLDVQRLSPDAAAFLKR